MPDDLRLHSGNVESKNITKCLGLYIDNKLRSEGTHFKLESKVSSGCYAVKLVSKELDLS